MRREGRSRLRRSAASQRITSDAEPEAPPALPEAEIVKRFAEKRRTICGRRPNYTLRRTVRIQEFGPDGQPSGEFVVVLSRRGMRMENIFEKLSNGRIPHCSVCFQTEDIEGLQSVPAFRFTAGQLAKYSLKYLGKEQYDEIDCYIFRRGPRQVETHESVF